MQNQDMELRVKWMHILITQLTQNMHSCFSENTFSNNEQTDNSYYTNKFYVSFILLFPLCIVLWGWLPKSQQKNYQNYLILKDHIIDTVSLVILIINPLKFINYCLYYAFIIKKLYYISVSVLINVFVWMDILNLVLKTKLLPSSGSFSTTAKDRFGCRVISSWAVAMPTIPPPTITTS